MGKKKNWKSGAFKTLNFQGREILYGVMQCKAKKNEKHLTYSMFGTRYIGKFMVFELRKGFFRKVYWKRLSERDPAYKKVMELRLPKEKLSDKNPLLDSDYVTQQLNNQLAQRICLNTVLMNTVLR